MTTSARRAELRRQRRALAKAEERARQLATAIEANPTHDNVVAGHALTLAIMMMKRAIAEGESPQ